MPDFRSAALARLLALAIQYGIVLAVAALLGWWRGPFDPASYALTRGDRRWSALAGDGIMLRIDRFSAGADSRLASDRFARTRNTVLGARKTRALERRFLALHGRRSFLAVPLCEELFTRGHLLGRVSESFSAGGSLVAMAAFFSLAHGQYRHAEALSLGAEAGLLLWSMALGFAVYRTGSLVPAIVAHAMINVP